MLLLLALIGLQEGSGQVLSLCIRIYYNAKSSPTVVSTAAATVRQAVALLFDHAVVGSAGSNSGTEGVASGREVAAVLLLQDLLNMCAGEWLLLGLQESWSLSSVGFGLVCSLWRGHWRGQYYR